MSAQGWRELSDCWEEERLWDGPKASAQISDLVMASAADQTTENPGQGSISPDLAQTLSAPWNRGMPLSSGLGWRMNLLRLHTQLLAGEMVNSLAITDSWWVSQLYTSSTLPFVGVLETSAWREGEVRKRKKMGKKGKKTNSTPSVDPQAKPRLHLVYYSKKTARRENKETRPIWKAWWAFKTPKLPPRVGLSGGCMFCPSHC